VQDSAATSVSDLDLDRCAQEPIRIPGAIQPFAALALLTTDELQVVTLSANWRDITGSALAPRDRLDRLAGAPGWDAVIGSVREWAGSERETVNLTAALGERQLHLTGTRSTQGLLIELEPIDPLHYSTLDELYPQLRVFLDELDPAGPSEVMLQRTAAELRRLTGFDRVLVYRFDADGHGTVLAEDNNGVLPVYLNHRFPAGDIPQQARDLYCVNRIRLIPDAGYRPVALEPAYTGSPAIPVDLTHATWRSVSPIHLEYMRNMGTLSSMSVSLVVDGSLWGLLSCHSAQPRMVSPQIRAASELMGRVVAHQIGANERMSEQSHRIALKKIEVGLVEELSRAGTLNEGFQERSNAWMELAGAQGAALVWQDGLLTMGDTPTEPQLHALADWLTEREVEQVYATDQLEVDYPPASEFADVASGLAALSVSRIHKTFLLWFRPEVVRTVSWRGNPHKSMEAGPVPGRLHPRKSFDIWQEQVRHRSIGWRQSELDALADFRTVVVNQILKRAEERAELTEQLQRSNVELESFSYSVSHDLRAPFRHIAGFAELLKRREDNLDDTSTHYIDNIVRAAVTAGRLVDDLLRFSHLGRAALSPQSLDMDKLVNEVRQAIELSAPETRSVWNIQALPPAKGDPKYIRQVWYNLMENAVKYSRGNASPRVSITGAAQDGYMVYVIQDNGVGFDMAYAGKLFGVFQRLHHHDDFEGTGIGLALSKRIVDKHGGWIKGEGAVGAGARFSFALPAQ
jgi:light-regulated signal transduction histidine kinase (bacteriophytochrome)